MSKIIDEKMAAHIAKLARIAVAEADLAALVGELNPILDWVGQLEEVKSSNAGQAADSSQPSKMREDIPAEPISVARALENAPESQSSFFITPKTNE